MTMSLGPLLFSFKGRIQRLYWWVATIAVGAWRASPLRCRRPRSLGKPCSTRTRTHWRDWGLRYCRHNHWSRQIWINLALSVKRLHDRDRSGAWVFLQILLVFLAVIMIVVAIAVPKEQDGPWMIAAGLTGAVTFGFSVWLFVELGFLRGTRGPNRFGPDPLGDSGADATL